MNQKRGRNGKAGLGPHTLAIDIGGTGLKASVLDARGRMIVERVRIDTPHPCPPPVMLRALKTLVAPLPRWDRISVGFPGVVRHGRVITAPHFGNDIWHGQPLAADLEKALGKPVRLLNDAEVQGLGIIAGHGLEVVLTLGTGVGSAIFQDGAMTPHLELAQVPLHKGKTYNEYLGNDARRRQGEKKWNQRVLRAIAVVDTLLNYDRLYLGGGNSAHLSVALPPRVKIASNDAGITGGIHLWEPRHDQVFTARHPVPATRDALG